MFDQDYGDDEFDWWSKYYASIGDSSKCGEYLKTGMDIVKVALIQIFSTVY